ncbi:MAG: hypothetical protein RIS34_1215 [Pseudomonadota bacterium]|jgi:hypothetical protein
MTPGKNVPALMPGRRRGVNGWRSAWCALCGLTLATTASAMSIRELRGLELSDKKQGAIYVQYYLVGAMEGALEAHAQAVRAGAKPLFCLNGRRLEPRMAKPLFDAELKRNVDLYEADMPVQLVLVNALSTTYLCG